MKKSGSESGRRDKANLPEKVCPVCKRPFAWRKKWERCWDEVVYCSDACRKGKGSLSPEGTPR